MILVHNVNVFQLQAYFISIVWSCYKYLICIQTTLPLNGLNFVVETDHCVSPYHPEERIVASSSYQYDASNTDIGSMNGEVCHAFTVACFILFFSSCSQFLSKLKYFSFILLSRCFLRLHVHWFRPILSYCNLSQSFIFILSQSIVFFIELHHRFFCGQILQALSLLTINLCFFKYVSFF